MWTGLYMCGFIKSEGLGQWAGSACRKDGRKVKEFVQKHKQYSAHIWDQDSWVIFLDFIANTSNAQTDFISIFIYKIRTVIVVPAAVKPQKLIYIYIKYIHMYI